MKARLSQHYVLITIFMIFAFSCKKKEEVAITKNANTLLVGKPTLPQGMKSSMFMSSVGKIYLPAGPDWQWVEQKDDSPVYEIENKKQDIKITLQVQEGTSFDTKEQQKAIIEDFVKQFIEISHKNAPHYQLIEQKMGSLGSYQAARIDGQYETAKLYFSRDYFVFAKGKVLSLQVRGPAQSEASMTETKAVSDAVIASFE